MREEEKCFIPLISMAEQDTLEVHFHFYFKTSQILVYKFDFFTEYKDNSLIFQYKVFYKLEDDCRSAF